MAAQIKDAAWMEWLSPLLDGASRHACAATLPPGRYHCSLDELPMHLLPRGASRALLQDELKRPLFLSPNCEILHPPQVPRELMSRADVEANFALEGAIAWVRNGVSGYSLPFWLGDALSSVIRGLRPEQDARTVLSSRDCRVLAAAGILNSGEAPVSFSGSREFLDTLRNTYSEKEYATHPALLHPFHVAALRRYYRYLVRSGTVTLGDAQSPRRYVAYNEPVARFFHHSLTNIVSAVAGEPVKPSYVYLASYLSGAELKKHTDREQCEFSISFCLDFSPEPEGATSWPLCLQTTEGTVKIHQSIGDGLFYRGTRVPHFRDTLSEGLTSTSIFFHYVPKSFTGSVN